MKYKLVTIALITFFSILLWIFVSFSNNYSTTVKIPIRLSEIPEGYSVKELSTKEVTLSLKGEGWQLAQMTMGVQHQLDIPVGKVGENQIVSVRTAIEQNSWITSNVQVTLVEPQQIKYSLERINFKKVKISSKASLKIKPGYGLVSNIKIIPDTVMISGPRSAIRLIDSVETAEINLTNLDLESSVEVGLKKIDNITFSEELVKIEFDIQKIVDKTFENIPVIRRAVPPSRELSLFPEKVKVVLRGGIKTLGRLDGSQIKLYVDFRQALEDTLGSIEPIIEIPEFTTLIDIRPKRLDYIIKQF